MVSQKLQKKLSTAIYFISLSIAVERLFKICPLNSNCASYVHTKSRATRIFDLLSGCFRELFATRVVDLLKARWRIAEERVFSVVVFRQTVRIKYSLFSGQLGGVCPINRVENEFCSLEKKANKALIKSWEYQICTKSMIYALHTLCILSLLYTRLSIRG